MDSKAASTTRHPTSAETETAAIPPQLRPPRVHVRPERPTVTLTITMTIPRTSRIPTTQTPTATTRPAPVRVRLFVRARDRH